MRSCSSCNGFVPASQAACPHCDERLEPAAASKVARWRNMMAFGVLAGSTSMTLMACYGAPCAPGDDYCGSGLDETGGFMETCDETSATVAIAGDLPASIMGTLTENGSNVGSCGGTGGEVVYSWTPPAAGSYRFETSGTLDTVIYLRSAADGNCGEELACNDEFGMGGPAQVIHTLTGEPIVIIVDGYTSNSTGDFTLTIEAQ